MRLSIKTCTLDMPFEAMLDFCVAQGVQAVEIGTGNWSGAPHRLGRAAWLETARQRWMDQLRRRNIALCAPELLRQPLAFQKDWEVTEKTFRLAKLLGVEKIVMMSGLPAGCPGDKTPVWITTSWPPETQDILDYQWNEVAIPSGRNWSVWRRTAASVRSRWKTTGCSWCTTRRPCSVCGRPLAPMVGMNLDPSHLFWMGGDPIEAARVLGEQGALYHVHGKDSRPERRMVGQTAFWTRRPSTSSARSWNYVAVGCGHGSQWWKEFSPPCGWRAMTATCLWKWRT